MTDAFKPVRLPCSHGPDLHFDGRLLGEYTTQNRASTKSRWTELRLWETPAGNWIAESVGCSSRSGEGEIREARVVNTIETPAGASRLAFEPLPGDRLRAMETWGWTTAAKAFARQLNWDVIQRVP